MFGEVARRAKPRLRAPPLAISADCHRSRLSGSRLGLLAARQLSKLAALFEIWWLGDVSVRVPLREESIMSVFFPFGGDGIRAVGS
jgi:hypothetical protein